MKYAMDRPLARAIFGEHGLLHLDTYARFGAGGQIETLFSTKTDEQAHLVRCYCNATPCALGPLMNYVGAGSQAVEGYRHVTHTLDPHAIPDYESVVRPVTASETMAARLQWREVEHESQGAQAISAVDVPVEASNASWSVHENRSLAPEETSQTPSVDETSISAALIRNAAQRLDALRQRRNDLAREVESARSAFIEARRNLDFVKRQIEAIEMAPSSTISESLDALFKAGLVDGHSIHGNLLVLTFGSVVCRREKDGERFRLGTLEATLDIDAGNLSVVRVEGEGGPSAHPSVGANGAVEIAGGEVALAERIALGDIRGFVEILLDFLTRIPSDHPDQTTIEAWPRVSSDAGVDDRMVEIADVRGDLASAEISVDTSGSGPRIVFDVDLAQATQSRHSAGND